MPRPPLGRRTLSVRLTPSTIAALGSHPSERAREVLESHCQGSQHEECTKHMNDAAELREFSAMASRRAAIALIEGRLQASSAWVWLAQEAAEQARKIERDRPVVEPDSPEGTATDGAQ